MEGEGVELLLTEVLDTGFGRSSLRDAVVDPMPDKLSRLIVCFLTFFAPFLFFFEDDGGFGGGGDGEGGGEAAG